MRRFLSAAAVAALAAAATACSDSGSDAEYGKNLAGEPINLSVIASGPGPIYQPELLKAARAAVNAVNDAGGVKPAAGGEARPLKLVDCEASTVTDPNAAVKCAREAIGGKVVATVVQAFQAAQILLVGTQVQTEQDFVNPASFPLEGGSPMLSAATGAALQDAGAKTVAVVTGDPSAAYLHAALMTQSTTHWTIAAALRPHAGYSEAMAHKTISTGILQATVAYHSDVDVTEWLLYANRVVYTGRGMTQGEGRVHTEDGRLVASYSVQGMIRPLTGAAPVSGATL